MLIEIGAFACFALVTILLGRSRPKRALKRKGLKENERKEIRYKGRFYDVTNWIERHPGGRIIEFYTNNDEDASIAIQQFHLRSASKVQGILKSFKSRPIPEEEATMAEKSTKYQELTEDFYKLFNELKEEGLFEPCLVAVGMCLAEIVFLGALGMYITITAGSNTVKAVGILVLVVFQMRAAFFLHEGEHYSLTGRPRVDRSLSAVVLCLSNGLSGVWWRMQHNKHHAMPQRLHHDVDLKTLPLFAYNVAVMGDSDEKCSFWVRHQAYLVAPVLSLIGRVGWQMHLHPMFALKKKKYHELLLFPIHYYAAYQIGFLPYILMLMISSSIFLITFSMSHSHLPVTEEPRHWVEYSMLHTMNMNPSFWCDYCTGYLNYQIEHHLFPTMPEFRLRSISGRVRELAEKHGLPYRCVSYVAALGMVFRNLAHVSKELREKGH
jgi:fatty acid desaturase